MLDGYRFRLYPTPAQQPILLRWIGCQRLLYNAKVQEDRYYRRCHQRMVGTAGAEIPLDQEYRRFITDRPPFLRAVPSQILRNGAVKFRQAYQRCFPQRGGRPNIKKKNGRQAVGLTQELFTFTPQIDRTTGDVRSCPLTLGTKKFPVGILPYVAHRWHAVPSSLHGTLNWLSAPLASPLEKERPWRCEWVRPSSMRDLDSPPSCCGTNPHDGPASTMLASRWVDPGSTGPTRPSGRDKRHKDTLIELT